MKTFCESASFTNMYLGLSAGFYLLFASACLLFVVAILATSYGRILEVGYTLSFLGVGLGFLFTASVGFAAVCSKHQDGVQGGRCLLAAYLLLVLGTLIGAGAATVFAFDYDSFMQVTSAGGGLEDEVLDAVGSTGRMYTQSVRGVVEKAFDECNATVAMNESLMESTWQVLMDQHESGAITRLEALKMYYRMTPILTERVYLDYSALGASNASIIVNQTLLLEDTAERFLTFQCRDPAFPTLVKTVNKRCLNDQLNATANSTFVRCYEGGMFASWTHTNDTHLTTALGVVAALNTPKGIFCACSSQLLNQYIRPYVAAGKVAALTCCFFFAFAVAACVHQLCVRGLDQQKKPLVADNNHGITMVYSGGGGSGGSAEKKGGSGGRRPFQCHRA